MNIFESKFEIRCTYDFFLYDTGLDELKKGYHYSLSENKRYLSVACTDMFIFDIINKKIVCYENFKRHVHSSFLGNNFFFRFEDGREFMAKQKSRFEIIEFKSQFPVIKSNSPFEIINNNNFSFVRFTYSKSNSREQLIFKNEKTVYSDFLSRFEIIVCFATGKILFIDVLKPCLKTMLMGRNKGILSTLPLDVFKIIFNLCV